MTRILFIISLIAFFTGCGEPQADVSTTKSYRSGGITFEYPDNWKITDEIVTPAIHSLFVESPGDAIVIFQSLPIDEAEDFSDYIKSFSQNSVVNVPSGMKLKVASLSDVTVSDGYSWATEEFTIDFMNESVPHRRQYGTKEIDGRRVFLILQVANEDAAKTQAGFELIQDTLRGVSEGK